MLSEPTLLWAAKGELFPHVGGTDLHRAHNCYGVTTAVFCAWIENFSPLLAGPYWLQL